MDTSSPPSTVAELLRSARARLRDPREASLLVGYALGIDRARLYAHPERAVSAADAAATLTLVARRAAGEPVAYLTGRREFFGLEFALTPAVLIPRPETELLVELALARMDGLEAPRVADLGTGCGAVAIAIARARPDARIVAVDRSAAALEVARGNAAWHAVANVCFVQGAWLAPLAQEDFDLIAANPPYVAAHDPHLDRGDLRFEPRAALVGGADGLDAIRRIVAAAGDHLRRGGWLILEHGADQQDAVTALLGAHPFTAIEGHRDLGGHARAVTARRI